MATFKFDAFISYSRRDSEIAKRLERALKAYRPPKDLPVPQRPLSIFRDEADITGIELQEALERNLQDSAKLIVLCSPDARRSPYVNREIEFFAHLRGGEHIVPVLVRGIPNNEAKPGEESDLAFPEALLAVLHTPLAAELRGFIPGKHKIGRGAYESGWYKMLADLYADAGVTRAQIEQREKRRQARRRAIASGIVSGVMAALLALTIWALFERKEAIRQRNDAVSRLLASQSENRIAESPDLALLLAAAADRNAPTFEARQSLLLNFLERPRLRKFLWGHTDDISTIAFSPDGRKLASGGEKDHRLVVWNLATGAPVFSVKGHTDKVQRVLFTPDGKRLISAGKEGSIKVWDAGTGKLIRQIRAPGDDFLETFALSPDGQRLVAGFWGGKLEAWGLQTGAKISEMTPHQEVVRTVAFSRDGRIIASGSDDGGVAVWDGVSPRASQLWTGHANGAKAVAFRSDGKILAVAFGSGSVNLWDPVTGNLLGTLEASGHDPSEAASLSFSPDGTMLASAGALASDVTVWKIPERTTLATLPKHEFGVHAIAFSHDGRWLASVAGDGAVRLWETQHWRPARQPNGGFYCLAFSPDDRLLATCGRDRAALWDVGEPDLIASLQRHGEQVGTVLFSPDGAYLASASQDRDVAVWDVRGRKPVAIYQAPPEPGDEFDSSHGKELRVLAFSPDGKTLATGGGRGKSFGEGGRRGDLVLWDFARSGKATLLEGHRSRLEAVAFSPDGQQLAAADSTESLVWDLRTGSARTLRQDKNVLCLAFDPTGKKLAVGNGDDALLWDLTSDHSPAVLHGHTFPVRSVLFSPDGKTLASGSFDGTVRFWDLAGPDPKLIAVGRHERDINSMALSVDGRLLATGSKDQRVGLWEMKTGQSIRFLTGQDAEVQSVALSPDGTKVASASENGRVLLWDVATGEPIVDLRQSATSIAFSPDGKLLATGGGQDHRVMLWDARVEGWADHACAMANRNLTCDEWRQWMEDQPYRAVCPKLPAPHGCGTS